MTGLRRPFWPVFSLLILAGLFTALGAWQLQRRVWKLDLIAQVEARIHAAPVAPPAPSAWPGVNGTSDAYRRVQLHGVFLHDKETLVQALTERGAGWWVITPLRTNAGIILVNRGFVPEEKREAGSRGICVSPGEATVTGLLRISEPRGGFLRRNDPVAGRWYSRDVAAITAAKGVQGAAPFFVDADATPNPGGYPIGGLTVVAFRNTHLTYALTWFGLAAMSLFGVWIVLRAKLEGAVA